MKNKMKRENTGEKSGKSWEKVRWAKIEKKKKSIFGNLKDTIDHFYR